MSENNGPGWESQAWKARPVPGIARPRVPRPARWGRYRRQQNRILRLARACGGRLTVTETATDTGLTLEEADGILKKLADGGFVEVEVSDSGVLVYRFPEVQYGHEKHWSRSPGCT